VYEILPLMLFSTARELAECMSSVKKSRTAECPPPKVMTVCLHGGIAKFEHLSEHLCEFKGQYVCQETVP